MMPCVIIQDNSRYGHILAGTGGQISALGCELQFTGCIEPEGYITHLQQLGIGILLGGTHPELNYIVTGCNYRQACSTHLYEVVTVQTY